MKRLIILLLAAATLTACTSGLSQHTVGDPTVAVTSAVNAVPNTEPPATDSSDSPINSRFGEAVSYQDGLIVEIDKPTTFHPSDTSMTDSESSHFVQFVVTVTNFTGKIFDPNSMSITAQSGQTDASEVFDSAQNINGGATSKLLKGRLTKFKLAYGVEDPKDIVVIVTPDYDYNDAIFTSH